MSLTRDDYERAAVLINVEPAALRAVADVETSGIAFLSDGRPKILFEGHIFWERLNAAHIDPRVVASQHPTICYPYWTKEFYLGGAGEYERLAEAMTVHPSAADESASWGLFQLMGFNWRSAGYTSVEDMVAAFVHLGEREHLAAICRWMGTNGLAKRLAARDWAGFAEGYNGPGYRQNRYDVKLAEAYLKYRTPKAEASNTSVVVAGVVIPTNDWTIMPDGRAFVYVRTLDYVGCDVTWDETTRVIDVRRKP